MRCIVEKGDGMKQLKFLLGFRGSLIDIDFDRGKDRKIFNLAEVGGPCKLSGLQMWILKFLRKVLLSAILNEKFLTFTGIDGTEKLCDEMVISSVDGDFIDLRSRRLEGRVGQNRFQSRKRDTLPRKIVIGKRIQTEFSIPRLGRISENTHFRPQNHPYGDMVRRSGGDFLDKGKCLSGGHRVGGSGG